MSGRILRRAAVLVVLALLVLLLVADRLTESAAAHALSVKARETGLLAADPAVTIAGFPFLTQAVRGRYRQIDVTTHGIHRGGLRLDTVTGRFHGVHVGLVATLDGRVSMVPIDAASGEVDVTYADLNAFLKREKLAVRPVGGALVESGMSTVAGTRVPVSGPVTPTVSAGGVLTLTPVPGRLRGPSGPLPTAAAGPIAAAYTVRVTLDDLPFGLTLQQLSTVSTGLRITAVAKGLLVPVPADASQT